MKISACVAFVAVILSVPETLRETLKTAERVKKALG